MTKKIITILLAVMIALSTVTVAFAAGTPTITVSSATAEQGETVTLNVALSDNPGINTFSFGFDYDETRLNLTNVELASGIPGQFTYSKKAVWLNSADITTNGNFLTLTFDVLSTAEAGDAAVSVTYNAGDVSNYNEEDVNFQIVAGKVTVGGQTPPPVIDDAGEITVGTASAAPGETITIPVSIASNPGINTFSLGFDYDNSVLELSDVTVAPELGGQFTYSKKAVWLNSKDTTYTGKILTLTFKVLENAVSGDCAVAVTYSTGDISNYDEEDVDFNIIAGKVTVIDMVIDYDTRVTIDKVTGKPGDTVDVFFALDKSTDVKSMSVYDVVYDDEKLTLISGEWVAEDSIITDWDNDNGAGAIAYSENTELSGDFLHLTFEIKENVEDEEVAIDSQIIIKQVDETGTEKAIKVVIVPGSVNILNVIRGDVNGDGVVDSDDAIHLLYHTLLPERYEINQNGDFDGDSDVDSDDAIYLLYFTMLPERYPLA